MEVKMDVKVGDKVKIRSWSSMVLERSTDGDGDVPDPLLNFTSGMRSYCGNVYTVIDTSPYFDNEFSLDHSDYSFALWMVEELNGRPL